jgi:hypothetical protein
MLDRDVFAWHAAVGTGVSGSSVRDLILEAVELTRRSTSLLLSASSSLSRSVSPWRAIKQVAELNRKTPEHIVLDQFPACCHGSNGVSR